nr:formin-like protein 20 [Arachis hypogaea]
MIPPPKFLFVVVALPLLILSLSYFHLEAYGDPSSDVPSSPNSCLNCPNKCDPPCQQQSPPNPTYEAPPTPPSPTSSGYSIYGSPPPPHEKRGQNNKCPPTSGGGGSGNSGGGVECCTPPPPYYYTYNGPPNAYAPPYAYGGYEPPNPYTYVPYNDRGFVSTLLVPFQLLLIMMFFSFIFVF